MEEFKNITEAAFEEFVESELVELGWESVKDISRRDSREVFDLEILKQKLIEINGINDEIAELAIQEIKKLNDNALIMNEKAWQMLVNGIKVYDKYEDITRSIYLISKNSFKNDYKVVRQLEVSDGTSLRRPDITLFINGLPVCVMELKSPLATENVEDAFNQNESLKVFSPKLWAFNIINFLSNRTITKYGSITSGFKRFHTIKEWKTRDKESPLKLLFDINTILKFITTYEFFADETPVAKYIAAPHQIKAVENTIERLKVQNDNRGGVVWHTQGSGKSVTMLLLAKAIIEMRNNATILVVTDRNSLDKQLFGRFLNAKEYLRNEAISVDGRKDLIQKLNDKKHFGVYFTTVQKFSEDTGTLSDRDDIFILVDEAHRTQNNIDGERELSKEKQEYVLKFGYARYMRDAFPNAKITGFTGTPLMKLDKDTTSVFGEYTHVYAMNDAVEDGATVPIHYEMRKVKIETNEEYLKEMDEIQREYIKSLDPQDIASQQKIDTLLKSVRIKQVLEDDDVIKAKSEDILEHLDVRSQVLHGKAMIVANSREAAFKFYKAIIALRPSMKDELILVMTESNKDNQEMASSIVPKAKINSVAAEFRKPNSKYKVAIVVDMWLTGFDVQDLDVLYIDKIIKWHNLMQAIARVNRTYEDSKTKQIKENGLIVDYIGIWKFLADALNQYASGKEKAVDISIEDVHKAKEKLKECFDILNDNYIKNLYSFDRLSSKEQYAFIINSFEGVLALSNIEANKFVKLARSTKRFFRMSYSIIDAKDSTIAKCVEIINSLLTNSRIQTDDNLQNTIELIKEAVAKAVSTKTADVFVGQSKISKNINEVATVLAKEAGDLAKSSPRVAIEMFKHSVMAQISQIEKIRPVFAKTASNKLREIISKLEKMEDVEKVMDMLKELANEVKNEADKPLEFNDVQMQAFFEVISNDEYLNHNQNSEVLRRLAEELVDVVKQCGTEQFNNNPQVKAKISMELRKLLKNKYNYPPESLGGVSGILIDQITKQIRINNDFFRKDD